MFFLQAFHLVLQEVILMMKKQRWQENVSPLNLSKKYGKRIALVQTYLQSG